jgi:hypothetical protein
MSAQLIKNMGLIINTTTTGNGHGLTFNPGVMFSKGNVLLSSEMNFQRMRGNFTGGQLTFEYAIYNGIGKGNQFCDQDMFDVFLFVNTRYNQNQYLGQSQLKTERKIAYDSSIEFDKVRVNTVELYLGFGVRTKITNRLKWNNSIGIGGYKSLNETQELYRENSSICLTLKTGLSVDF